MSESKAEQLEDARFYAEIDDAAQVVGAEEAFRKVMPPLVDRLFDPNAQQQAIEFLQSPLLQGGATEAFNRRWSTSRAEGAV